ncbi:MAG: hypothetical protein WA131_03220 [Desulfitobacteriaceae bacterium]
MKKSSVLLLGVLLCIDVMLFPLLLYKNLLWIWIVLILFSLVFWPLKLLLTHKMKLKQETLQSDKIEWRAKVKPKETLSLTIKETKEEMLELTLPIIPEVSTVETTEIIKTITEELAVDLPQDKPKDSIEEEIWINTDKRKETNIPSETIVVKTFPDIKTGINLTNIIFTQEEISYKEDSESQNEFDLEERIVHQEDKFTDNENRECEVVETLTPETEIKIIGMETNWLSLGEPSSSFRKENLPETTITEMIINMIDQGFEAKNDGQLYVAAKWFNAALALHPKPDLAVSLIMDVFILWKTSDHGDIALERLELFWGEYQNKLSTDLRRQFNSWLAKENLQESIVKSFNLNREDMRE